MRALAAVGVATAALAVANARPAAACSPPPCWPGAFVPGNHAHVPANLPGIVWRPLRDDTTGAAPDPANVSLTPNGGGAAIALTATAQQDGTFVLAPSTALTPGTTYVLHDATACSFGSQFATPDATFTATPSAPLPTTLGSTTGTLDERQLIDLGTASGTCSVQADVDAVSLALSASPDATPWLDVLLFSTTVDGTAWSAASAITTSTDPGASWTGRGTDRVFEVCSGGDFGSQPGLASGFHTALFEAKLANTTVALAADSISFGLMCGPGFIEDDTPIGGDAGFPIDGTIHHHGGCSASGSSSGFAAIAFAAIAALSRRRPSRRGRSRSRST